MVPRFTWKVNRAVIIGVDLVDHILKFRLAWVLAERSHDRAQLLGRDLACKHTAEGINMIVVKKKPRRPKLRRHNISTGCEAALTIAIFVLSSEPHLSAQLRLTDVLGLTTNKEVVTEWRVSKRTYKEREGFFELGDLLFGECIRLPYVFEHQ